MNQISVEENQQSREKVVIRTSIIGIIANVFLAAFKAVIGILSNSISVTLDAVNNLSDAASSVITIVGTKLAGKEADKKHPFGYGRVEYLSAMIISILVLYAGITSFTESVKKILSPEKPDYSVVALVIIAVGVLVKVGLGQYVKRTGEKVNSDSLINSGTDATLDSIISASTFAAAIIYLVSGISLEAILGAVISVVIIKSGVDMLRETISQILGEGASVQLVRDIKQTILSFDEVHGVYDMVLNNYGPDNYLGSVHISVPDTMTTNELDKLIRQIQVKVYEKQQVILSAIGIYSINTKDPHIIHMREQARKIVTSHKFVKQMHGFYLDEDEKQIRLDAVISFDAPSRMAVYRDVVADLQKNFPAYSIEVAMDKDYNELS